jgi:hypothetical protein
MTVAAWAATADASKKHATNSATIERCPHNILSSIGGRAQET